MIRIGQVSNIDKENRTARVYFPEIEIMSGWLKVVSSPPSIKVTEGRVTTSPYMPAIGDTVICLYNDGFNEDGFIIGSTA